MASTSEHTFGNKLQHGRNLKQTVDTIAGFTPDNPSLAPAAFGTFLDSVEAANDTAASTAQDLATARGDRRLGFFGDAGMNVPGLRTLAGRVRDHVASTAGKKSAAYRNIQKLTQKITNYRSPKKPVSSSPGTTPAEKKSISQSERSYGSMVQAGRDLAAAVEQVPGYNPTAADLKPAALKTKMNALAGLNDNVAAALAEAQSAANARLALYDHPETGLQALFQQLKAAIASQFGRRSAEYQAVAGIKY